MENEHTLQINLEWLRLNTLDYLDEIWHGLFSKLPVVVICILNFNGKIQFLLLGIMIQMPRSIKQLFSVIVLQDIRIIVGIAIPNINYWILNHKFSNTIFYVMALDFNLGHIILKIISHNSLRCLDRLRLIMQPSNLPNTFISKTW